jgi:hypothetical protein
MGFADCGSAEPKWGSFFASFFSKKEALAVFLPMEWSQGR